MTKEMSKVDKNDWAKFLNDSKKSFRIKENRKSVFYEPYLRKFNFNLILILEVEKEVTDLKSIHTQMTQRPYTSLGTLTRSKVELRSSLMSAA